MPKSAGNYVKLFLTELGMAMKQDIMESYSGTMVDERIISYMLSHPEGEFIDHENGN